VFQQFLKFLEKTAPVAVYTAGKGSSVAGLTTSVTQGADAGVVFYSVCRK
jgi:DNA replicative helicase MCM subunit Mcm2 (Cdc46/Mcm family)